MKKHKFVIIGAGPAGLSAAITASRAGMHVTIIDENPLPGGQIYKRPPNRFKAVNPHRGSIDYQRGQDLIGQIESDRVDFQMNTEVWDIRRLKEGFAIGTATDGSHGDWIYARYLLIACGVYDRPIPFPGWTIPGVMTVGGAQIMLKSQCIVPGKRVIVAGSGPLLMVLACQLLEAGAEVVAVLEAATRGEVLKGSLALWRSPDRLWEGLGYQLKLNINRIPFLWGHTVLKAEGSERLERVIVGRIDRDGNPTGDSTHIYEVDILCTGFGFLPSNQLTRILGCDHHVDQDPDIWFPSHDQDMQTNLPGLFVAGDLTGIAGAKIAKLQGQLAGLMVASQSGAINPSDAQRSAAQLHRKLARQVPVTRMLNEIYFTYRPGLQALVTPETILCRCEGVTASQVDQAIKNGAFNFHDVKLRTRTGMGYCQSRYCGWLVNNLLSSHYKYESVEMSIPSIRAPIKPVKLSALAAKENVQTQSS